jgi:hypothetical protein
LNTDQNKNCFGFHGLNSCHQLGDEARANFLNEKKLGHTDVHEQSV